MFKLALPIPPSGTETFFLWGACDSEGVWTIDEGSGYPRLWWESHPDQAIEAVYLSSLLGGAGTEEDPYRIYTAEELNTVGLFPCEWDKHFKLMADIDLGSIDPSDLNLVGSRVQSCSGGGLALQKVPSVASLMVPVT